MDILASLIIAHLVGDYLLQNDRIADFKIHPRFASSYKKGLPYAYAPSKAFFYCALHCALYTSMVALFSAFSTMGMLHWSLLIVCFVAHFVIDHFRLVSFYMTFAGQKKFGDPKGICFPWSIFVVDNTFHLLTSWALIILQMWYFSPVK